MSTLRRLLRAGGRLYRRLFQRRLDPQTQEVADVLRRVPALGHLSSSGLHAMAAVTHRRTYRRGESLYYEGDPGLGLYVVESGRVRLVSDAETGRARDLRELEAPEMFGGLSILGEFPRLETAETVTEARVLGFFRPDLKNVQRRNPKDGTEIIMALARQMAAQHVELIRRYKDQTDPCTALQTYAEAAAAVEADVPAEM